MKKYLIISAILFSCNPQSKKNNLEEFKNNLNSKITQMQKCLENFDLSKVDSKLCTIISPIQLSNTSMDDCKSAIFESGFKEKWLTKNTQTLDIQIQSFIQSTKRAETHYETKTVYFKEGISNSVDCFHELVHINQWINGNEFAMPSRYKFNEEYKDILDKAVANIDSLIKENRNEEAMKLAGSIQENIDILKKSYKTTEDIDEVEAHFFILKNCEKLNCSDEDIDIATTNLFTRKYLLSKKLRDALSEKMKIIMKSKEDKALKKAKSNWIKQDLESHANKLFLLNDEKKLISFINSNKVNIYKIASSSLFGLNTLKEFALKDSVYNKIPHLPSELVVKSGSKISSGQAFGKYICNNKKAFIVINKLTSKETLVHEYLHHLQVLKNKGYCDVDEKQKIIQSKFQSGKVSRSDYEQTVLYLKALINLAEYDVYSTLLKSDNKVNKYIQANNLENYKKYKNLVEK